MAKKKQSKKSKQYIREIKVRLISNGYLIEYGVYTLRELGGFDYIKTNVMFCPEVDDVLEYQAHVLANYTLVMEE